MDPFQPSLDYTRGQSESQSYEASPLEPQATDNPSLILGGQGSSSTSLSTPASSSAPRVRRRNRMITSCLECRRRKLKCDKSHPCVNCTKGHRDCVFLAPALDQASQLKLTEIKEKVGSLERLLERDVGRTGGSNATLSQSERALPDNADDDLPGADDEKELIATPLAVVDAAYEDDGADDEMLDLGIAIGKMRLTERLGGFFRPRLAQELEFTLTAPRSKFSKPRDFLDVSAIDRGLPPTFDYLKPGPDYIAPASGFFFGPGNSQASLIDFLPSRLAADRLIKQYFMAVHPISQVVHRPSFEKGYETFWEQVSLGIEPPTSLQTIIFAAMFSGVVSMEESVISRDFGVSKESLIDNFKLGTETALGRAHFLRTTRVETLQAFVMYLIPLCRQEMSRAHSVLVGAAIRMAECMGLHRDGDGYGLNSLETHVRRLIWGQLCFLDVRTCEAQGPRPTIRRDDFDTKLPLNIDDVDINPSGKAPAGVDRWTDSTFTIMRFEINEMMRQIWVDRPKIERRKVSLTAVLSKIETFRRNMNAKFDHLLDDRIPLHKCALMVKNILMARLHVMTLHRYHNSVMFEMPNRLRQILVQAGTQFLENAVALDVVPEVQVWKWYSGAYHQYHAAFLLLIDVHFYPKTKEYDRIWICLDHVFETDSSDTRDQKARKILQDLQERTSVYQAKRKMRAPSAMLRHVGQRPPRRVDDGGTTFMVKAAMPDADLVPTTAGTAVGRTQIPDVTYAGVSNGEILWTSENQSPSGSSESSGGPRPPGGIFAGGVLTDDPMPDIDWDAFDALFPPEFNGELANFEAGNVGIY